MPEALSFITGYEDWPPSILGGAVDLRSATTAAFAIVAALLYRQRTGEGQYIDMASQEAIAIRSGRSGGPTRPPELVGGNR